MARLYLTGALRYPNQNNSKTIDDSFPFYINLYFAAIKPQQRQTETIKERKYTIYTKIECLQSKKSQVTVSLKLSPYSFSNSTNMTTYRYGMFGKRYITTVPVKEKEGSWICIVPHCEKLASEALRHGSHSFRL